MNRRGFIGALAGLVAWAKIPLSPILDCTDVRFTPGSVEKRHSMQRALALMAPTPLGIQVFGAPQNRASMIRMIEPKRV